MGFLGSLFKSKSARLLEAVSAGDKEAVAALLAAGADPNSTSDKGATALFVAASDVNVDVAKMLLQAGARADVALGEDRVTPLHAAARSSKFEVREMIELLLEAGADVNARTASKMTPLHCAALKRSGWATAGLLFGGADMTARETGSMGATALHYWAGYGDTKTALEFIHRDIDVNITTTLLGITPLHMAASQGQCEMIRLLVEHGADVNARMLGTGKTPLGAAQEAKRVNAAAVLEALGAE